MTRRCPRCGSEAWNATARMCARCGAALSSEAEERAPGLRPQDVPALDVVARWPGGSARSRLASSRLVIGRSSEADLQVDHPKVSREHAALEPAEGGYRIVDLKSRNGLYVAGRRVSAAPLREGDVVRLGGDSDAARIEILPSRGEGAARRGHTRIRQVDLTVGKRPLLLGRSSSCDEVLAHPMISREHARISPRDGGHEVVDLDSTNGTFVNGERIRRKRLRDGDEIRIGPYVISYSPHGLSSSIIRDGMRIEASGLRRDVRVNRKPKRILDDVTLAIEPGEFVALVGGSGAGKSTLLTALCGFAPADRGTVLVDGVDFYRYHSAFRPLLGYVPQTDIVHRHLTVQEALDYAARLRLPADTTREERAARIDRVLADVDMTEHREKAIHQLSGGQRKRVSTAVELLADPKLLFLDEPTSGLDPGLDKQLMDEFRHLADQGRTVVLVTHTTAHIDRCDHVVFLARGGRIAFFGPPAEAPRHFQARDFADIYSALGKDPQGWVVRFKGSRHRHRWIDSRLRGGQGRGTGPRVSRARSLGAVRQLLVLTQRQLSLYRRDMRNVGILLIQAPVIAGILYVLAEPDIFLVSEGDVGMASDAQTMINVMASIAVWFGLLNAAREITKERSIFLRERMAGLGVVPYLSAKLIPLALLCVLQMLILLTLVVARTGLPAEGLVLGPYLDLFVTLTLTAFGGVAMGLVLSSMVANEDRAMSIVPLLLIPQLLLGGVLFSVSESFSWLNGLTLTYWATLAMGSVLNLCESMAGSCDAPLTLDYEPTADAVLQDWTVLAMYFLVFAVATSTSLYFARRA